MNYFEKLLHGQILFYFIDYSDKFHKIIKYSAGQKVLVKINIKTLKSPENCFINLWDILRLLKSYSFDNKNL